MICYGGQLVEFSQLFPSCFPIISHFPVISHFPKISQLFLSHFPFSTYFPVISHLSLTSHLFLNYFLISHLFLNYFSLISLVDVFANMEAAKYKVIASNAQIVRTRGWIAHVLCICIFGCGQFIGTPHAWSIYSQILWPWEIPIVLWFVVSWHLTVVCCTNYGGFKLY